MIQKNKIVTFRQDKEELLNTHYSIRVVLNNSIDPMLNLPEIFLSHVLKNRKNL